MKERIERLCKYMEVKGLNANQVETLCGMAKGTISQSRKGKSDLGQKSVQRIIEKFQDLNRAWLLGGEGNMLIDNTQTKKNMESTVKERLMDFIKQKGISVREFERTCGLANGYVSNVLSSISSDKYNKILSAFPKMNPEWLLRGEGNMYIDNVSNNDNITNNYKEKYLNIIERYQEQISKFQEQISDVIQLIKKLNENI